MTRPSNSDRPDVAALAKAGDNAGLRRALQHGDAAIRARAADELARAGDLKAVALLRSALLGDPDDHVREETAVALGRLGDDGSVEALISVLQRDRSPQVREEAALALGRLGDERAIPPLLEAMNDRYTIVHRAAAQALSRTGAQAMERLVALAEGPRTAAADAARAALAAVGEWRPQAHRTPAQRRVGS
jgi:HEAT repeat protein